ncbi:PDR/VanB family oxidoreductase [Roseateles sp. LYH14W]|uniref:PDR/VanB family oxidoreductase n=1 Tax=Pelomonas parva TaxID=3299032 RepID=A0ABW7EZ02_9BURK
MSAPLLQLRVAAKRPAAQDVVELTLQAPDGEPLPAFEAGAHVELHLAGGLVRHYSLCNAPGERQRYVLGVLREPASRGGSVAVHEGLNPGDVLAVGGPKNHFSLQATAAHKLLLAGGIGITPVLSMARQLAAQGRSFTLHYAGRSRARMAFLAALADAPLAAHTHLHVGDENGSMDMDAVLAAQPEGSELYVCGPAGFIDAALAAARRLGWAEARLHRELFAAAPRSDTGEHQPFDIEVQGSGQVIHVPAGCSAAQALQDAGLPLLTSCEQGVCGTCLTRVVAGEPDHRDQYLTPEEQAANDQFLPCCSRARSPRLVIQLGG